MISGAVVSVSRYNRRMEEGHGGIPDDVPEHYRYSEGYPDHYDEDLIEPWIHTVDVAVAGNLSVYGASEQIPFEASLSFKEEVGDEYWKGGGEPGYYVWGLHNLVFTLELPSECGLTDEEVNLLTAYTFAPIDPADPTSANGLEDRCAGCMYDRVQVATRSPILLSLTDKLLKLTHECRPTSGQWTWQEDNELEALLWPS